MATYLGESDDSFCIMYSNSCRDVHENNYKCQLSGGVISSWRESFHP